MTHNCKHWLTWLTAHSQRGRNVFWRKHICSSRLVSAVITHHTQGQTLIRLVSWQVQFMKTTLFSCHYLRNRSILDIGVLGYISILYHKEHPPEVWHIPPGTPKISKIRNYSHRVLQVMLPSACSFIVLVVTVLHYMFRPTWQSSGVGYYYFHMPKEFCFAAFLPFFHVVTFCNVSICVFPVLFSFVNFVVSCVCVCLLAFCLLFVCSVLKDSEN
jgi:hypothetical protein